jgi:hypothetical protein
VNQSLEDIVFEKTSDEEILPYRFKISEPVKIALPAGESYLRFVSADKAFPYIDYIELTRCDDVKSVKTKHNNVLLNKSAGQDEFKTDLYLNSRQNHDNIKKVGIQLTDVYNSPELMEAFLDQLTNEELARLVSGEKCVGYACSTYPLPGYGLPYATTADGPLGLRLDTYTAAYPSGTLLAQSWNPEIAQNFGIGIGCEAQIFGVDIWLAPGMNIQRDPRCGRNFEYYSEDPLLSGIIAAGVVRGVQSMGVAATVKHYTANNTEHERLKSNSRVSERALREIYLKNFETVIKLGDPWCIMSSYNHINNVKVAENNTLITEIPRNEWGWQGLFMTDYGNDSKHVAELKAGHNLKMSAGDVAGVTAALENGTLTRECVKKSAERVLSLIMKLNTYKNYVK